MPNPQLIADVVPPTAWVVEWIVLPLVAVLALVGFLVYAVIRHRRQRRAEREQKQ